MAWERCPDNGILCCGQRRRGSLPSTQPTCFSSTNPSIRGSQILKVRNRSSATFFSPQFRNRFDCPQYCGIAEGRTRIADAHRWPFAEFCKLDLLTQLLLRCCNRSIVLLWSCPFGASPKCPATYVTSFHKTSLHKMSLSIKRPFYKTSNLQNVQSTKRPSLQNVLLNKRPHLQNSQPKERPPLQNVPLYITSSSVKRPFLQSVPLFHFLCTIYFK